MHVIGGTVAFIAAERGTAAALAACDIKLPASVAALVALGACVSVPALGAPLQLALGPSAAWMRQALAWLTAPAFLFPAICDLPEREVLPKLALLGVGGVLCTCAATGHLASALARHSAPAIVAPCASSTAAAAACFSSPWTALAALSVGIAASAALHCCLAPPPAAALSVRSDTAADAATASSSRSRLEHDALVRGPAYVGGTLAFYVAAQRVLPPAMRKFLPPNVGCALAGLPLLLALGGADEVRCYLTGAGAALLWAVQPAMVTLGLYAFTHRAVFRQQWRAALGLALAAPALLFCVAGTGSALGLEPMHTASLLPASTTTGLALTMPSGMPLIQASPGPGTNHAERHASDPDEGHALPKISHDLPMSSHGLPVISL